MTADGEAPPGEEVADEFEVPLGRDRKAWKDPARAAAGMLFDRPARTPCESAWKIEAVRDLVHAWLELAAGPETIAVRVKHRDERRLAVFLRDDVVIFEWRMRVARDDAMRTTIFCGRRLA